MKTIEEAAIEHMSKINLSQENKQYVCKGDFGISFHEGVDFAQRWIPVEEELPEKLKQVIVKLENGWHTCTWITEDGTFAFNIKPTHWRYIDLK